MSVRKTGQTVPLAGMSDGALDQLYLALRIASLEHYFAAQEPAPFVIDDVLLNFDDERAGAALSILNDLSEKTHIVFFTHHRHLVELAKKATGAAAGCRCRRSAKQQKVLLACCYQEVLFVPDITC